jgi:hypothetical protein
MPLVSCRLSASVSSLYNSVRKMTVAALLLLGAFSAQANAQNTYAVTRFDDTSFGTLETGGGFGPGVSGDLRYGLFQAMANGGANTISFPGCTVAAPCTIVLGALLPPIFETSNISSFSLTIDGGAQGAVIVDGNSLGTNTTSGALTTNRVFFVDNVAVTLKNLVIQNATAQGGAGESGYFNGGGGGAGFGAGGGGGGGLAFAGGTTYGAYPAGSSGGGVSGSGASPSGGSVGGQGGGGGASSVSPGAGGSGYASNTGGAAGGDLGGTGGFGGGGGGDFGSRHAGNSAPAVGGIQGGSGFNAGIYGDSPYGGGGIMGSGMPTTAGAGTASAVPVFNYGGTVNGSASIGPIQNAFTVTEAVGSTSATQTATLTFSTAGTPAIVNVVTQGAANLDFQLAATQGSASTDCVLNQSYNAGATCSVQYTFTPWQAGSRWGGITLTDGKGNPLTSTLATAFVAGIGTAPEVTFKSSSTAIDTLASASNPTVVAVAANGDVYYFSQVGDGDTLFRIPAGCSSTGCELNLGSEFQSPSSMAVDGAGNIYVEDYGLGINLNGASLTQIPYGFLSGGLFEVPAECASSSCLTVPSLFNALPDAYSIQINSVAVDSNGNVYIGSGATEAGAQIPEASPCGTSYCVTLLGGNFGKPMGMAVDGLGNVYVADRAHGLEGAGPAGVYEIPSGCTNAGCVVSLGGGFNAPVSVAVDAGGNVHVADSINNAVYEMPPGCASASCVATLGQGFNRPYSVSLDDSGNVYVAETGNNAIKEITLATPPALSFTTPTADGATDTADGPQTVTVVNIGNAPLTFFSPTPSISSGFSLGTESTSCVQLPGEALAPGGSCTLTASFAPVLPQSGSLSGSITLTDNVLNTANAQQSIPLSGTAIVAPTATPSFTAASVADQANVPLYVQIANPNASTALTGITATITLPAGLQVVAGSFGGGCATGTPNYSPSSSAITYSGLILAGGASCTIGFTLTATAPGNQTVSAVASTSALAGGAQTTMIYVTQVVSAANSSLTASAASAAAGSGTETITATVLDLAGNPINGATVAFTAVNSSTRAPSETASFGPPSGVTSGGVVTATLTDTVAEPLTITATISGR